VKEYSKPTSSAEVATLGDSMSRQLLQQAIICERERNIRLVGVVGSLFEGAQVEEAAQKKLIIFLKDLTGRM